MSNKEGGVIRYFSWLDTRKTGILTTNANKDFTKYDTYLRFLKLEASDALYIQHMGIHVYFVELGYSKSSVQRNQAAHFYLVEEMNHPTAIPSYPKPLLAGSTSFFY